MTWYAWSPIDYGAEKDEKDPQYILNRKRIEVGQEVSPSDLEMEEDSVAWKELVDGGSVRDYEMPEDLRDPNTSPQKIVSARLVAMEEGVDTGQLDSRVVSQLMSRPKNFTEGQNEVSPEGEVTTADQPPPSPSGTTSSPAPSGLPPSTPSQ